MHHDHLKPWRTAANLPDAAMNEAILTEWNLIEQHKMEYKTVVEP